MSASAAILIDVCAVVPANQADLLTHQRRRDQVWPVDCAVQDREVDGALQELLVERPGERFNDPEPEQRVMFV